MLGFKKHLITDEAINGEEKQLRTMEKKFGAVTFDSPSDAYWAMLPQRIMARIAREQKQEAPPARVFWWKPASAICTVVAASAAFVLLRSTPVTLDQAVGSLSAQDVQTIQVMQDGIAQVPAETPIETAVAEQASSSNAGDFDAALTLNDVTTEQATEEMPQQELTLDNQMTIENLNDQEANAVLQSLKASY